MGLKLAHDVVVSVIVFVFQDVDCEIRCEKKVRSISPYNPALPSWLKTFAGDGRSPKLSTGPISVSQLPVSFTLSEGSFARPAKYSSLWARGMNNVVRIHFFFSNLDKERLTQLPCTVPCSPA